jgi:replicative DNA helicase
MTTCSPPSTIRISSGRRFFASAVLTSNMATIPDLTLDAGLPANVDAEKTILGAILLDNAAHAEAAEKLESDDFSLDSHRRIFLRMSELMDAQRAVDIVTLANELARYKEVESVGGVAYLASLTEGLPRRPVIEEYIRIVKDKSLLRKLMGICSMAIARAADQGETALSKSWAPPSPS